MMAREQKHDLLALAERCEKAEGPDRELDRDIEPILGFIPVDAKPCKGGWIIDGSPKESPRYTASLDSALTLVPEGYHWTLSSQVQRHSHHWLSTVGAYTAHAATPALALCAAALRARSAS